MNERSWFSAEPQLVMPEPIIEGESYVLSCSSDYGSPQHDYLEEDQIPDIQTMINGNIKIGTKSLTQDAWYTLKYVSYLSLHHPAASQRSLDNQQGKKTVIAADFNWWP